MCELAIVDDAAAADGGVIVTREMRFHTANLERRCQPTYCTVNSRAKRRDTILSLSTKQVIGIRMDASVLIGHGRDLLLTIIRKSHLIGTPN